jgi:hypothetical protein
VPPTATPTTTPPETTINSGPAVTTTETSATFTFSSSAAGASFDCALDGSAFSACASPKQYTGLALGQHTFSVRAKTAAGLVDPTPATGTWTIQPLKLGTQFLHNNPSPPTGDTQQQANLPLDDEAPTATTLRNYDSNRDAFPGRMVAKGGSGANESDLTKYQNWRSDPLPASAVINGQVKVTFFSAMKDFAQNKRGNVTVFLRAYNGSSYQQLCQGNLTDANWQGGSNTWVSKTITFSCNNVTIPAGQRLEVKIVVGNNAGGDMWFAYDTTAYQARVEFP